MTALMGVSKPSNHKKTILNNEYSTNLSIDLSYKNKAYFFSLQWILNWSVCLSHFKVIFLKPSSHKKNYLIRNIRHKSIHRSILFVLFTMNIILICRFILFWRFFVGKQRTQNQIASIVSTKSDKQKILMHYPFQIHS